MFSRRSFLNSLGMVVIAGVMVIAANFSSPAAAEGPDGFIRVMGQEAIDSLTSKELSRSERQDRFRAILQRSFDIRVIARFTLGRYWRRASKPQRKEYVQLFEDFIVQAYAARFEGYSGGGFEVGRMRSINDKERLVLTNILLDDGRKIPVHWRVRGIENYRVIDVVVEGVSMAITQRDEFSSIINQHGGKVDGLLVALRKKTGKKTD
ncbi:MAG: ABC transporter substrate-binding protein [Alphaproteobacteria bacterium]